MNDRPMSASDPAERIASALERIAAAMERMQAEPDPLAKALDPMGLWDFLQGFSPLVPRRPQ